MESVHDLLPILQLCHWSNLFPPKAGPFLSQLYLRNIGLKLHVFLLVVRQEANKKRLKQLQLKIGKLSGGRHTTQI